MLRHRKIKIGTNSIDAVLFELAEKNLIVLKGRKGYVMCGYLNLKTAEKFKDAAVKIVGAATLEDALKAKVHSFTSSARRLGVYKGQPVRQALRLL